MGLTLPQLEDVCLLYGGHKQCRYLAPDESDYTKWYCTKKSVEAAYIDEEVEAYLKECKANHANPKHANVALGDNCNGYSPFTDIQQGYDLE